MYGGFPISGIGQGTGTGGEAPTPRSSIQPIEGPYTDSRSPSRVRNPDGSINPALTLGATGPTGPAGLPQMGGFSNSETPGASPAPSTPSGGWGGMPVRPPSENSMQRAQTEAEGQNEQAQMRSLSPQRRYFWSTGRVDARAAQAPQNARTDFDSTFGPDRAHMGTPGTTWAQRQASNERGISNARELRGLSPY